MNPHFGFVALVTLVGALAGLGLHHTTSLLPFERRRKVPARAVLLPVAGGALFAILALFLPERPFLLAASALYTAVYLAVTVIDYETHRIPNIVILPATGAALLLSGPDPRLSVLSAFLGAALSFLLLFIAVVAAERFFGAGAFGMGDAKLAAFIGATVGVPLFFVALALGIFAAGFASLLLLALRLATRRTYIPYGPFLCVGGWITLLWGREIVSWWLGSPAFVLATLGR